MTIIHVNECGKQIDMYAELLADFENALDCFYYGGGRKLWFLRATRKMSEYDAKKLWKEALYFMAEHKQPDMNLLGTIKLK